MTQDFYAFCTEPEFSRPAPPVSAYESVLPSDDGRVRMQDYGICSTGGQSSGGAGITSGAGLPGGVEGHEKGRVGGNTKMGRDVEDALLLDSMSTPQLFGSDA